MPSPSVRAVLLVLAATVATFAVAADGSARNERQSAASWAATAAMAARGWAAGTLPRRYAMRTTADARDELGTIAKTLSKRDDADARRAETATRAAEAAVERLHDAVAHDEAAALPDRLGAVDAAVRSIGILR